MNTEPRQRHGGGGVPATERVGVSSSSSSSSAHSDVTDADELLRLLLLVVVLLGCEAAARGLSSR